LFDRAASFLPPRQGPPSIPQHDEPFAQLLALTSQAKTPPDGMAHPGGNITGFSFLEYSMVGKSLEMLKQMTPSLFRVAVMFNPKSIPTTMSSCARSRAPPARHRSR
jgi:hypothetical protein